MPWRFLLRHHVCRHWLGLPQAFGLRNDGRGGVAGVVMDMRREGWHAVAISDTSQSPP